MEHPDQYLRFADLELKVKVLSQIVQNERDKLLRSVRMSMKSFIYKSMNSCDNKGSTLRAALRNPVINGNKFACPSGNVPFKLAGNKAVGTEVSNRGAAGC